MPNANDLQLMQDGGRQIAFFPSNGCHRRRFLTVDERGMPRLTASQRSAVGVTSLTAAQAKARRIPGVD